MPSPPKLPEDTKRAIFLALVEAQDAGVPVDESRAAVAKRFRVQPSQVKAVEKEGLDKDWPPLGDGDPAG